MTLLAAEHVGRFGITPKIALLSYSSFGSSDTPSAGKMREAIEIIRSRAPDLDADGEMNAEAAISEEVRKAIFPKTRLRGEANLLIMPTLDAANIALNLLRGLGDGVTVGPILLGLARPAHILTQTAEVRRIVNMSTLAVVEAQVYEEQTASFRQAAG